MKCQGPGAGLQKNTKNDLPEAPRDPPGAPREGQERPKRRQEGPKKAPRAAKSPKSRSEAVLEGSWRPLWAHMAPRGAPEASRPSFGALRAPSGSIFGFIFDDFSTFVSHSFPVMFFFVFACVLVFALCFLKASKP